MPERQLHRSPAPPATEWRTTLAALRGGFAGVVVLTGVLMTLAWAVRARRIQPFSGLGRFVRRLGDPLIAPVERRIIRAGGTSQSAPWWTLVFVLIGGLAVLALLTFVRDLLVSAFHASSRGPARRTGSCAA